MGQGSVDMKVLMSDGRRRDGWLLRLALYALSGVLIAYVLWGIVSELWVHEEYVGASLAVAVTFAAILAWFLHRNRPRDKFQFYHPWKIQETVTSRDLWLIAGFDTLVGLATLGVFVLPVVFNYGAGTVFFAAIVGVMMLATLPNGYRHLRRQYDLEATRKGLADRRTLLRYRGYSETHHQWMPLAGVPTSALVFVALLFVFALLF